MRMKKPYRVSQYSKYAYRAGNKLNNICEPSSGGIGNRLKIQSMRLKIKPAPTKPHTGKSILLVVGKILKIIPKGIANKKLERGPAKEV